MELGITIPLQRCLGWKAPPYSTSTEPKDCWDLHCITLGGRSSLLAVHCPSRYTFTLFDLTLTQWQGLAQTFSQGLVDSCTAIGLPAPDCTSIQITKTHGRREVAYLNRAWDDVVALDYTLDTATQNQPLLDYAVNTRLSNCAGWQGKGLALQRFIEQMKLKEQEQAL